MALIKAVILSAIPLILLVLVFKRVEWDKIIDSRDRKTILANISIVFAAAIIGFGVTVLLDLIGEENIPPSLSIPLIIIVLEYIGIFTLVGAALSFLMFVALKNIFNVK
jgi:hypothetical protein